MKKLLSILSSMTVAAGAALGVVACSVPSTKIDITFTGMDDKHQIQIGNIKDKYDIKDIAASMRSQYQNLYGMDFDSLNSGLLNLLSFNESQIVKNQNNFKDLRGHRDLWMGRDQDKIPDGKPSIASVDGIYFGKDIDGSKDEYYNKFGKTYVNSLQGLKDLHEYKGELYDSLKASKTVADELFKDGSAADTFMKDFTNSKENPAFTKIEYEAPLDEYSPKTTLINPYSQYSEGLTASAEAKDYIDINRDANEATKKDSKDKEKPTDKVNNKRTIDPYGVVLLGLEDESFADKATAVNVIEGTSVDAKDKDSKKQTLSGVFSEGKPTAAVNTLFTKTTDKDGNSTNSFDFSINNVMIQDVKPFSINYTYDTNVKNNNSLAKDNKEYSIKVTIDGLKAIFIPVVEDVKGLVVTSISNKDGKTIATLNKTVKEVKEDINGSYKEDYKIKIGETDIKEDQVLGEEDKPATIDLKGNNTIVINDATYNVPGDLKDKRYDFSTKEVTWAFAGYKFLDSTKMNQDLLKDQAPIKSDDKQEAFTSEVSHNYKDTNLSNITIEVKK